MIEPHCLTNDRSQADLYFRLTSSTWGNGFVGFHGIPPPSGYRFRRVDGPERSGPRGARDSEPISTLLDSASSKSHPAK